MATRREAVLLVVFVLHRIPTDSDRTRLASVCRRWRTAAAAVLYSRWSSSVSFLPEILDLVLRCLDSHVDRASFASVCRLWRHVARRYSPPLPPAMPWIIFPHGVYFQSLSDGEVRRFLRRRDHDDEQCHGSFDHNWLFFKEIGNNRLFLENPLTRATIELPGHCNEPVFLFSNGTFQTPSNLTSANFDIYKVTVCSADLGAALIKYDYHNVVVCCRPGMLSWSTGISKTTNVYRYQDMAFYKGMLYAVANGGDLFEHEVSKGSDTGEPGCLGSSK
ncbi:hypothetical protein HU200_048914 [Digitaria exilis]|uniref:KIB1-4 beta-propeller domain-containing protein n=1 Tax=Digitaria exilis TaxID=1010633 RepID=A0A835E7E0_9POAL|nr:hypothetical protein HU200_048914 [Digitaria exilis]